MDNLFKKSLLLFLFFFLLPLLSFAQFIPLNSPCTLEPIPANRADGLNAVCQYCSSYGTNTPLHLKWDIEGNFQNPVCSLGCWSPTGNQCSNWPNGRLVDDQGRPKTNLKPKDDVFIRHPFTNATSTGQGTNLQVVCYERDKPSQTKVSAGVRVVGGCEGATKKALEIKFLNGDDFYPGQDMNISWNIANPKCSQSKLQFVTYIIIDGQESSPHIYTIEKSNLSGVYTWHFTPDKRYGFDYLIRAQIISGECKGAVSNDLIANALRANIEITEPKNNVFYNGDIVNLKWKASPPTPNDLPLILTLINDDHTAGVDSHSISGNTNLFNTEINNTGSYSYKIPLGTKKRNSIFSLCYYWMDTDMIPVETNYNDWRDDFRSRVLICGDSDIFQFGGDKPRTSRVQSLLTNVLVSLINLTKI